MISLITLTNIMRIALTLEYNGSAFHGWQAQPGLLSVQTELEKALSILANEPIKVVCAGRTDTGVHAKHQVVHFDTQAKRTAWSWTQGTNHLLHRDICIRSATEVSEDFHARFSALSRSYEYWIDNRSSRPALERNLITWIPRPLNAELMHTAALKLLGTHNFNAFRAVGCQAKNPQRTILEISVQRVEERIVMRIRANAFLHHMVRNIIGVLLPIGLEQQPVEWIETVLASQKRSEAGITAAPHGLYLSNVEYPERLA